MSDNSYSYNKDKIPIHKTYDITIALNKIVHKVGKLNNYLNLPI